MEHEHCENCVYKEMYCHLAKATEDAIRILIQAQQDCEDILLDAVPQGQKKAENIPCPENS